MHVMLLSQYYEPEPFKGDVLGGRLAARGHEVSAVTGFPNYPYGSVYPGYRQKLWGREEREGVQVLRLPLYPDHSHSAARRSLNYLSFALSASILGPLLTRRPDVIWVHHPPLSVGMPALALSRFGRIPFVLEIQDLWPETLQANDFLRQGRLARWLAAGALSLYRRASAIIVISPGFKKNLVTKGVAAEKIHVISNWADEIVYRPVPRDEELACATGMAGRFNVVFAGNMGPSQALGVVLDAADRLRDVPDAQFVMIGDGISRRELEATARQRGLENVIFIGRKPKEEMPGYYALADALLVHLRKDPLFEITIPSKTLAYLASARPIICAVPGDAADVVHSAGAGLIATPEDPVSLADAVRRLARMPRQEREAMGRNGRAEFEASYSQSAVLDRYEVLFHSLTGGAAG